MAKTKVQARPLSPRQVLSSGLRLSVCPGQLKSNSPRLMDEAVLALRNLARQCSDSAAMEALTRHLFAILGGERAFVAGGWLRCGPRCPLFTGTCRAPGALSLLVARLGGQEEAPGRRWMTAVTQARAGQCGRDLRLTSLSACITVGKTGGKYAKTLMMSSGTWVIFKCFS